MSYKTMKQSQDWRQNYNWWDKNDHPVHEEKLEENEFQPKVLKDQVVKFYKKPKTITLGSGTRVKSYGVIDGPLCSATQIKEVK
tara:strand:+ start:265 stop:516 length:252 start_codon:yes stop_codon:yes gene_type:complete